MLLVYGKKNGEKRFKPVDMKNNKFVVNKFHASTFTDDQKIELEKEVQAMNKLNPDFVFEIREQG